MCACGAENFSSFYPGCNAGPPKTCDCGRAGSAGVQETKFSNMVPPSFLCNRIANTTKTKEKPKSCSCPTKKDKVAKKCKCVDKGVDTCDLENEVCKNACEMSNADYTNMIAAHGTAGVNPAPPAVPPIGIGNDVPGTAFMEAIDPLSNVLDMNLEQPQRVEAMPAAGLPSRTCPQFDPCTGLERQCPAKPAPQAAYMPYMGPIIPLPSLSPYFYPNFQCCQKPTQGPCCCAPSAPLPKCACDAGASTTETAITKDKVEKANNNKGNKNKVRQPNGKSKEKSNKELQIVNCCNASSDLVERICTSLQVPRPPESCYLLLPIKMATDGNEESMQPDGRQQNAKIDSPRRSKDGDNGSQPAKKCNKPTRNCGCNTVISGNLQDNDEDPQQEEDEEYNNPFGNCCNSCCSPARCCWPCCYYNPCTGCYYWRNNCCCRKGCCNNSCSSCPQPCPQPCPQSSPQRCGQCCSQSCPLPKGQSQSSSPKEETPNKGSPNSSKRSSADRVVAGAITTFKPEIQELYERWLGFNQYAVDSLHRRPPTPIHSGPIYYRAPQFTYRTSQCNIRSFRSPPPPQVTPRRSEEDIDWAPL